MTTAICSHFTLGDINPGVFPYSLRERKLHFLLSGCDITAHQRSSCLFLSPIFYPRTAVNAISSSRKGRNAIDTSQSQALMFTPKETAHCSYFQCTRQSGKQWQENSICRRVNSSRKHTEHVLIRGKRRNCCFTVQYLNFLHPWEAPPRRCGYTAWCIGKIKSKILFLFLKTNLHKTFAYSSLAKTLWKIQQSRENIYWLT